VSWTGKRGHAEELVIRLLALQAPVATDLRRVVSALWIVGDVHRISLTYVDRRCGRAVLVCKTEQCAGLG